MKNSDRMRIMLLVGFVILLLCSLWQPLSNDRLQDSMSWTAAIGRKIGITTRDGHSSKTPNKKFCWREHIKEVCDDLKLKDAKKEFPYNHIIVNKHHKVLYCQIPKVACTNWQRIFIILSGKVPVADPMLLKPHDVHNKYKRYLTRLSDLSPEEVDVVLNTYFKFVIVREPLERLLSAYKNKFLNMSKSSKPFQMSYGRLAIKQYRINASKESLAQGHDLTFLEFVQSIVDPSRKNPLNEHWAQFNSLCHPCVINYDFIGKYHKLEENAKYILDTINASSLVKFPSRSLTYKHNKTEGFMRQFYKQIPAPYLDQLWKAYYPDFQLFNYTVPDSIRNLTDSWNHPLDKYP